MANVAERATTKLLQLLKEPAGLSETLAAVAELEGIHLHAIESKQILTQKTPEKFLEQALDLRYPTFVLYCEKINNDLREKFRTFSGKAHMAIEARMSQDRIEGLGKSLGIYVDTLTRILDQNRGDWGSGMFYTGGYEAVFGEVKHGGRNFIQTGIIRFEVLVSID